MDSELKSANEALAEQAWEQGFRERATAFVCPFPDCRAYAHHTWGKIETAAVFAGGTRFQDRPVEIPDIRCAWCHACKREVLWVNDSMVVPAASDAPPRSPDMPDVIHREYDEAAAIINLSPRGAAALLRLAVEKLLPLLGATERNIDKQIAELVGKQMISLRISTAFDTLRVIGNEAVHPGTMDLDDDFATAMSLFRLLNYTVEKAITEPRLADELFAKLPQGKRDIIGARNARALSQSDGTA